MPSPNPRVQVCMEPELYALITTLAAGRNVTRSWVIQQLLTDALSLPKREKELAETVERIGNFEELPDLREKPDQRHHYKHWDSFKVSYKNV